MKTFTADASKRILIPDAKPGQIFAYASDSSGTIILTPVEAGQNERFPRGSLLQHLTPERDEEQLAILKGCTLEVPE